MPDIFTSEEGELQMTTSSPEEDMPAPKKAKKHHTHAELVKSSHKMPTDEQLRKLPGHTRNPLSAYCYYPSHVTFSHADAEEKIVLVVRKHPLTNVPWIIIALVMSIAPFLVAAFPFITFFPPEFQFIGALIWYLITLAFVFEQFLTWYFNVNIVTDERVFDVDFHNLLYREITDADLDQIQDVTVRMGSAIRTIFNYGDVLIQTAGEVPQIEFEAVPHPDQIAKILRQLRVEEDIEQLEGRIR